MKSDSATTDGSINRQQPRRSALASWIVGLAVLFFIAALGFAFFARFGSDERLMVGPMEVRADQDVATATATTSPSAPVASDDGTDESSGGSQATLDALAEDSVDVSAPDETSITTTTQTTTPQTIPPTSAPVDTPGEPVEGTLSSGSVLLTGIVPSPEIEMAFVALVEQLVGEGNVLSAFEIVPGTGNPDVFRLNVEETVLFESGGDIISTRFFPLLDDIRSFMEADPTLKMTVEGHADSRGDVVTNLALSERRADAVVTYLVDQGLDPDRLEAIGFGDTTPVGNNETPEGRSTNRRIEVTIIGIVM